MSVTFSPGVNVNSGRQYYLYMDSWDEGIFTPGTGSFANGNWSGSNQGEFPGPYADGTGWIYVWSTQFWGDNGNVRPDVGARHQDYAFRVYYD